MSDGARDRAYVRSPRLLPEHPELQIDAVMYYTGSKFDGPGDVAEFPTCSDHGAFIYGPH